MVNSAIDLTAKMHTYGGPGMPHYLYTILYIMFIVFSTSIKLHCVLVMYFIKHFSDLSRQNILPQSTKYTWSQSINVQVRAIAVKK